MNFHAPIFEFNRLAQIVTMELYHSLRIIRTFQIEKNFFRSVHSSSHYKTYNASPRGSIAVILSFDRSPENRANILIFLLSLAHRGTHFNLNTLRQSVVSDVRNSCLVLLRHTIKCLNILLLFFSKLFI